jgi:hypothetical protein
VHLKLPELSSSASPNLHVSTYHNGAAHICPGTLTFTAAIAAEVSRSRRHAEALIVKIEVGIGDIVRAVWRARHTFFGRGWEGRVWSASMGVSSRSVEAHVLLHRLVAQSRSCLHGPGEWLGRWSRVRRGDRRLTARGQAWRRRMRGTGDGDEHEDESGELHVGVAVACACGICSSSMGRWKSLCIDIYSPPASSIASHRSQASHSAVATERCGPSLSSIDVNILELSHKLTKGVGLPAGVAGGYQRLPRGLPPAATRGL